MVPINITKTDVETQLRKINPNKFTELDRVPLATTQNICSVVTFSHSTFPKVP